jgi:3',5'-cyclic AMP phosphodiesterase CpdA
VAVLGVNTARSLTFKDGRISEEQVEFIRETFSRTDPETTRVLVTHHPLFAVPVGEEVERAVGRQELALDAIEAAGVDLLLAGHAHHASAHDASELVTRSGGALVVQAGTATSTRVREQQQSFNTIDIDGGRITVTVNAWTGDAFKPADAQPYQFQDGRWRILKAQEPAH